MSGSVTPTQLTEDQASLLCPVIAGLFIQGIESGLVLAQFSQWFNDCDRIESLLLSTVVVFVTLVGLCAFRHFIVRLQIHYPIPFMKCAVRIELCIGLVYGCTALRGVRMCGLLLWLSASAIHH